MSVAPGRPKKGSISSAGTGGKPKDAPLSTSPQTFGKVAVLMGGTSAEREISLMSGNGVLEALRSQGWTPTPSNPARSTRPLSTTAPRVLIARTAEHGEDGSVQGASSCSCADTALACSHRVARQVRPSGSGDEGGGRRLVRLAA